MRALGCIGLACAFIDAFLTGLEVGAAASSGGLTRSPRELLLLWRLIRESGAWVQSGPANRAWCGAAYGVSPDELARIAAVRR